MQRSKLCLGVLSVLLAAGCSDPLSGPTGDISEPPSEDGKGDAVGVTGPTVPVFAITDFASNTVDFMDTSGRVLTSRAIPAGGVHGIAYGEGTFVEVGGRQISFLNRNAAIFRPTIAAGVVTENVFFGGGVFLITKWDGTVLLVDRNGGVIHPGVRLSPPNVEGGTTFVGPIGAAFGDGVFAVGNFDGTIAIIDRNGVILRRGIQAGAGLRNVAFGDGVFAATAEDDDSVTIFDKNGTILVANAPIGRRPRGIAFGEGVFMVAHQSASGDPVDAVSIIDSTGNRVVADVPTGITSKDMTFGHGLFAIANFGDSTISLITSRGVRLGNFPVHLVAGKGSPVAVAAGELVQAEVVQSSSDTPKNIPDNQAAGITSAITLLETGSISGARVEVNISHTWRGDLFVNLVCPDNTRVPLHQGTGGSADNLIGTFNVSRCNGKSLTGTWKLEVSDRAALDIGTLNSWTLRVLKTSVPSIDQLPGSCQGSCGGRSTTGSCWCDAPCLMAAGQCCFDKQFFCGN